MSAEGSEVAPPTSRLRAVAQAIVVVVVLALSLVLAKRMIDGREVVEPAPPIVEPPLVETLIARTESVQLEVAALGEVVPKRTGALTAEVAGRVEWIAPELVVGGQVAADSALVRLDTRDLEVAAIDAAAGRADASAALERERAEAARALAEWRGAGREGEPPPLARRGPQLAQAEARVAAAEAMVQRAQLDLERAELRAPFDASVREVSVAVGAYVQRGQALATVFQVAPMELRLALTDRELGRLEPAALGRLLRRRGVADGVDDGSASIEARFVTRFAGFETEWRGELARIEGEVDPVSRMVRVIAEVAPNEPGTAPLLAGLFVDARLEGRRLEDVVVLPRRALFGAREVLVVGVEGRLERRTVETVDGEGEQVVVIEGLEDGEQVIVSPLEAPVDGMRVRIDGGGRAGEVSAGGTE